MLARHKSGIAHVSFQYTRGGIVQIHMLQLVQCYAQKKDGARARERKSVCVKWVRSKKSLYNTVWLTSLLSNLGSAQMTKM